MIQNRRLFESPWGYQQIRDERVLPARYFFVPHWRTTVPGGVGEQFPGEKASTDYPIGDEHYAAARAELVKIILKE